MSRKAKKLIADFFMLMALTTSVSFVVNPNIYELITAVTLNLIATILKIGARGILNIEYLATSIVADFHLIPALIVYGIGDAAEAVSLVWGAVVANTVSIVIMLIEAILSSLTEEEEEEI
jgi:hypothetical protein